MKNMYYVALATLVAAFSCTKEANTEKEQAPVAEGRVVTLGVTMPGKDTKIDHSLVTNAIHREWSADDKILVVNRSNTNQKETFVLYEGAGTQSGKFKKDDSTLPLDGAYKIYHTSDATPGWNFNFGTQKGTLAALPEYLVNENTSITSDIALTSRLTYFHFVFSGTSATPGEARTFENAYLVSQNAEVKLYSSVSGGGGTWNEGVIKVHPDTPFTFAADGTCAIDIYVAARITGTTKDVADAFELVFMNGDYYPGIESYSYTWTPGANYEAGQAYATDSSALLTYNNGLVGKANNTSTWFEGFKDFDIPVGKKMTVTFINDSSGDNNHNNWNAFLRSGNAWDFLACLRADKAAQIGAWGNWDNSSIYMTKNGNTVFDWSDFIAKMKGSTVIMDIDNGTKGYVYFSATSTSSDNTTAYKYTYGQNKPADEVLHVTFPTDLTHYVMKSVVLSASPDVQSISATATAYYEGNANKIVLSPSAIKVTKTYADASSELVESSIENRIASNETVGISGDNTAKVNLWGGNLNCTGVSVTATKTTTLTTTTIGSTAVGWGQESDSFTVAPGTSQTIAMNVASAGESAWQGPVVMLRSATNSYICACRIDNYILDAVVDTRYSSNWGEIDKASILNGSKVLITVANDGKGYVCIRYNITDKDSNEYYQYYDYIAVPTETIQFTIKTDKCALTWQ